MPVAAYPIAVECVLRCGPLGDHARRASSSRWTSEAACVGSARRPGSYGARATMCCRRFGRRLANAITGATMVEIPDAGHSPMWETPDEFHRGLLAFLEGACARAAANANTIRTRCGAEPG